MRKKNATLAGILIWLGSREPFSGDLIAVCAGTLSRGRSGGEYGRQTRTAGRDRNHLSALRHPQTVSKIVGQDNVKSLPGALRIFCCDLCSRGS
jgi:hypothetical protein